MGHFKHTMSAEGLSRRFLTRHADSCSFHLIFQNARAQSSRKVFPVNFLSPRPVPLPSLWLPSKHWLLWQRWETFSHSLFFPPLQAPADSSSGQGLAEGGAQENSAILCEEVTKLTTALQEYQDIVQVSSSIAFKICQTPSSRVRRQFLIFRFQHLNVDINRCFWCVLSFRHQQQQQTHDRMVSSSTAQLKDTRQELREKQKEKKEAERFWQNYKDDQEAEGRRLRDSLQSRDKLIEVICHLLVDLSFTTL